MATAAGSKRSKRSRNSIATDPSRLYQNRAVDTDGQVRGGTTSTSVTVNEEVVARAIQNLLLRSDARNGRLVYV